MANIQSINGNPIVVGTSGIEDEAVTIAIVDAVRTTSIVERGDYVGAFYSSNNVATITLPRAGRYTILAIHNSTPTLNGIAFATGDTVFKIAGAASITFTRSGNTITATTTGGNPGYYVTAYDV